MSDSMMSSYSAFGSNEQGRTGNTHSFHYYSVANGMANSMSNSMSNGAHRSAAEVAVAQLAVTHSDGYIAPQLSGQFSSVMPPGLDKTSTEVAMRRLTQEIAQAKAELYELEKSFVQELVTPSVREWLLPLMAIGLVLSLYGSFASANTTELGATGLVLLWSLSAFWYILSRDKRSEMIRQANQAEIEIWSSRIEELQKSFELNSQALERMDAETSA